MAEEGLEKRATSLEGLREWLLQLEHRLSDLERESERARRRRRRMFWYFIVMLAVYLLSIYWSLTTI